MGRVKGKVAFITGIARGQGRRTPSPWQGKVPTSSASTISTPSRGPRLRLRRRRISTRPSARSSARATHRRREGGRSPPRSGRRSPCRGVGRTRQTRHRVGKRRHQQPRRRRRDRRGDLDQHDRHQPDGRLAHHPASIPRIRSGGRGGSIILTSSAARLAAFQNVSHYVAAKHGVTGLMRALASSWLRRGSGSTA